MRRLHTPIAYILGGPTDIAYPNGMDDFARIEHVPVFAGNLPVGHGGTFRVPNGGDWARVADGLARLAIEAEPGRPRLVRRPRLPPLHHLRVDRSTQTIFAGTMTQPLAGIRIADFSHVMAGLTPRICSA